MQILEAIKPFEIQEISLTEWRQRPVKNNFFELVLIREGKGTQCINYNLYDYQKGSLFLLPPLKCHSFQIEEPTQFIFLKFTPQFFHGYGHDTKSHQGWFKEAAYILSNYNQLPGDIIHEELDRQHLYTVIDLIVKENANYQPGSPTLIKSLMVVTLEILLRNIKQDLTYKATSQDARVNRILTYIHEHIHEPELLKVNPLAQRFHLSATYFSEYFRKHMEMSLREYVIRAKLKWVEIRLLNSDYTLTEIADELRFTDVSHLSKTFKKYTGMSIREFKTQGEYQLLKRDSALNGKC